LTEGRYSPVEFKPTWDHVLAGWPPYLDQAGVDPARANRAFARLRSFFGDDPMALPRSVFGSLINVVPQSLEWIVWFADCLDWFAAADGYTSLCTDLRDANKHDAAATVLQVADRMHTVGMGAAFDPSIIIDGIRKVPDLLLRDRTTGASFYAEASIMFSADRRVEASDVFDRLIALFHSFHDDPVSYGGLVLRPIAPDEIEGFIGRVWWEILEVRRDRSFREIRLDDALLLGMAPEALKEDVDRWAKVHGFEPGSFGAMLPSVNDFLRLHGKIAEEAQQLPSGQPNVVVIWAQSLLLISRDPLALLPHIRGIAREHPKVALLVVVFEGYTSAQTAHAAVGDCLIVGGTRGGIEFQHIIVPNDTCPTPFPHEMLQKLKSAFAL